MRIIITKNGKYFIKELEEERTELYNFRKTNISNAFSLSPRLPRISRIKLIKDKLLNPSKTYGGSFSHLKKPHKNKSLTMMKDYFNRDESKIDQKELEKAKKIKLAKPKLVISQKFLEKYLNSDQFFKEKLNKLSNLLDSEKNKKKDANNDFNFSPYKLNDEDKLNKLKSYIAKDNTGYNDVRIPLDKNNQFSYKFRSKFENKKEVNENLFEILNKTINSDRTNLIKYLKRKKQISPYYFKNLSKYDEAQIYKLNKMCGVILNEEKIKSFSEKKTKYKSSKKKSIGISSKGLSLLLNHSNRILNDYEEYKKYKDNAQKKGFKEMIKNTKRKYWDKFNIEKLFNKKKEFNDSSIDEYNINNTNTNQFE